MDNNIYVRESLELHLFFGRIMKEHALFLQAGFTPANETFSRLAEFYKEAFGEVLARVVTLSNGVVSPEVLRSGEVVTEFTRIAEMQTEHFTSISIDSRLTERELELNSNRQIERSSQPEPEQVQRLNQLAMELLEGLISFKETILESVLQCKMFTMNYPLLIEHIIREANHYKEDLQALESEGNLPSRSMQEMECFWNQIMMEHAEFIRGQLDPTEAELITTANGFAVDFSALLQPCNNPRSRAQTEVSLAKTTEFRDFKRAGTEGIEGCKIRSVILPLLADHVLREANHYIRMLTI